MINFKLKEDGQMSYPHQKGKHPHAIERISDRNVEWVSAKKLRKALHSGTAKAVSTFKGRWKIFFQNGVYITSPDRTFIVTTWIGGENE